MSQCVLFGQLHALPDNGFQDAETAIDYADGIVVSNHGGIHLFLIRLDRPMPFFVTGGRQVDGAIAALDALDRICASEKVRNAQRSGTFHVLFDSGIRTGSDIIKALALGAQAVLCECLAVDSISRSLTRTIQGTKLRHRLLHPKALHQSYQSILSILSSST